MAQVSLRIGKLKTSTLGAAQNHNQREEIPEHVIPEKTHLNQTLIGGKNLTSDVMNRITEKGITVTRGKQNESTVAIEIVLSASPEYFRPNSGERGDFDRERLVKWGNANLSFLREKFGENLVRLDLHLDESTPHMHAIVTPVMRQERKIRRTKAQIKAGSPAKTQFKEVLNASKMFNKAALIQLQTEAADAVKHLGIERGTRKSHAEHTTLKEWYADQHARDLTAVEVERNEQIIENQSNELAALETLLHDKKQELQSMNNALQKSESALKPLEDKAFNLSRVNARAERHLNLVKRKIEHAEKDLAQLEQDAISQRTARSPQIHALEKRLERAESSLRAYQEKFGPIDTEEQKNAQRAPESPKNDMFNPHR